MNSLQNSTGGKQVDDMSSSNSDRPESRSLLHDDPGQQQLASLLVNLRSPPVAAPAVGAVGGFVAVLPLQQASVLQGAPTLNYQEELARLRRQARQRVEDAIMAQPEHAKQFYLEAKEKAPKVVEEESNHLQFLRTCNYDIWKAADRMLLYWTDRRDIFGPDRFYLPLTTDGKGALGEDEIRQIKTGYPAILPTSSKDNRPIMVCDRALWLPSSTPDVLWRCIFYSFALIAKNQEAQSHGITCLLPLNKQGKPGNAAFAWRAMHLVSQVFPVKVAMRVISYNGLAVGALNIVRSVFFRFDGFEILNCGSQGDGLRQILVEKIGMDPNGLPISMGGQWDYSLSWGFLATLETREGVFSKSSATAREESSEQSTATPCRLMGDEKPPVKRAERETGSNLRNNSDILLEEEVEQAIKAFPYEQKEAYMEAKDKAPLLVVEETDPRQFSRFCKGDATATAKLLCEYWTERRKAFGSKLFFRPLVLSRGALEMSEGKLIQAGLPALLPAKASTGQKVIYIDYRQRLPNTSADNILKALFHIMAIVAQDPISQSEGVLMLVFISVSRTPWDIRGEDIERCLKILAKTMPVKMHWHLLNCTSKSKSSVGASLVQQGVELLAKYFPQSQPRIHEGRTKAQLGKHLVDRLGLSRSGIPLDAGGTWKFEEFSQWLRGQNSAKQNRYASLLRMDDSASLSAESREEERKAKRRVIELIQSRRKRERKREEQESLQNEFKRLKIENTQLRTKLAHLEELYRLARGILADRQLPLPRLGEEQSKGQGPSRT